MVLRCKRERLCNRAPSLEENAAAPQNAHRTLRLPESCAAKRSLHLISRNTEEVPMTKQAVSETFDPVAYINKPRWQQMSLGLSRIEELLEKLGRPQDGLRFVHVAGTNGKGSVCAYLASALQESGYRTGLFTSPYIERFEERIRVNGTNIPADALLEATLEARDIAESMTEHPTEFELMCAVALLHFSRTRCDIVVMEVGLGGRFDATNIIERPEVSVICRLGLDHTGILGNTMTEIATEKAGIIKPGCPTVSWPQEPEGNAVLEQICQERNSRFLTCDFDALRLEPLRLNPNASAQPMRRFVYRGHHYQTRLLGSYQPSNAALAIDALRALRDQGWQVPDTAIEAGIAACTWPGRFELCATRPLFIVDGGHNPQGAQVMAETLQELLPDAKPVFLIGILADKDYPAMLHEVVPLGKAFVCVTPQNPRALPAAELAKAIEEEILRETAEQPAASSDTLPREAAEQVSIQSDTLIRTAKDFPSAVALARKLAGESGVVCAFGSLYSIADVKAAL